MSPFTFYFSFEAIKTDFTAIVTWFVTWFCLLLSRALCGPMKTVCNVEVSGQVFATMRTRMES